MSIGAGKTTLCRLFKIWVQDKNVKWDISQPDCAIDGKKVTKAQFHDALDQFLEKGYETIDHPVNSEPDGEGLCKICNKTKRTLTRNICFDCSIREESTPDLILDKEIPSGSIVFEPLGDSFTNSVIFEPQS